MSEYERLKECVSDIEKVSSLNVNTRSAYVHGMVNYAYELELIIKEQWIELCNMIPEY